MMYFPNNQLFCAWPGSLFTTAKCGQPAPVRYTLFCSHISVYGVWPLVPAFLGPNCRPSTVCPPAGLHIHGVPYGVVPLFSTQTGDQG